MAKELPYFKFEPNEWENGNIQIFDRETKGLFIDLCSMYWSRTGDLPFKLAIQKLCGGNATALNSLCDENIIEVIDGFIFIKFLSIQLNEFADLSKQNSENAKIGWEKRRNNANNSQNKPNKSKRNATALNSQSESNAIREDKSIEDKIKEEKINPSPYGDGRLHFLCKQYSDENPDKYPKEFYINFLQYWTAIIQKGAKKGQELWRDEKAFSIGSRLATSYKMTWENKNPKEVSQKIQISPRPQLKALELTEEEKYQMRKASGLID
jgi:hypothetical protein